MLTENKFNTKITTEFKKFINSLPINKKAILNSKVSFLENTGFMSNCKALGNNIFEFNINDFEKGKIYYYINDNSILFFNILKSVQDLQNILKSDNLILWLEFNKELLRDNKYAKLFYNEIHIRFKQTDEESFLMTELKNIAQIQNEKDFKKITGFDIGELNFLDNNKITNKIETTTQLIDRIHFLIKLRSIEHIVEKSKISKETINNILKIKENIKLKDLENLIKYLNK